MQRPLARWLVVALVAAGHAVAARAQAPSEAPRGLGQVSAGGEVSGTFSSQDDGFFTYTDYEQDSLRQLRIRLLGEWRPAATLALIGEARTLNIDRIEAAAWYFRWQPSLQRDLAFQLGRIPPVVGAFPRRAYGRDNPLLTAPLAYQYVTSLRPDALPLNTDNLLAMRGRGWRPSYPLGSTEVATGIPLIATTDWHSGAEAHWRHDWFEAAGAFTLGSPGAPLVFSTRRGHEWSGRIAATLHSSLVVGLSGARGHWIDDDVLDLAGGDARDHRAQSLVGVDAEWGRGPWLVRGEWLRTVFGIPMRDSPEVTRLPAQAAFLEARYRLTARWQVAGRIDGLRFDTIPGVTRPDNTWEADVTRLEGVVSYRITRQLEARGGWLQHWRDGGFVRRRGAPAVQGIYWF
jgi:hypothetical protein